jgi:hypothetical protein
MEEKIKRLVQSVRPAVADMIQAKTSSRQPNEAEIYLAIQGRGIIILAFAARVRQKQIES